MALDRVKYEGLLYLELRVILHSAFGFVPSPSVLYDFSYFSYFTMSRAIFPYSYTSYPVIKGIDMTQTD